MFRWIICLSLLLSCTTAKAHQPDLSSTLLVEQGENKWILQVRAALTAFEYEVEKRFGASAYTSPEEFKKLISSYVKEDIIIQCNDKTPTVLQNGKVKLGHETSITYEVMGLPENIQSLVVKNTSFSHIPRNQSALIVLKKGFSKDQFILNNNNKHTVELKVMNTKFELVNPTQGNTNYFLVIFVAISLVIGVLYFVYRNKRNKEFTSVSLNA